MIVQQLSALAEEAAFRYLSVIYGFRGAYAKAIAALDPFHPSVAHELDNTCRNIARSYLDNEVRISSELTTIIATGALRDAQVALGAGVNTPKIPELLREHLNATLDYLQDEITIQLERDITATNKKLKTMLLQANLHAMQTGGQRQHSLIYLKAKDRGEPRYYFVDRISRKWPSQKFIRTLVRQHLLSTYNDSYAFALVEMGEIQAKVVHLDPQHKVNGLVLSLTEGEGRSYQEIRDEVFHPNADAVLTAAR